MKDKMVAIQEENARFKMELLDIQEYNKRLQTQLETSSVYAENKMALIREENEGLKTKLVEIQKQLRTQLEAASIDSENKMTLMKKENERLKVKSLEMQEEIRQLKSQLEGLTVQERNKEVGSIQPSNPSEKTIIKEGISMNPFKWFKQDSQQVEERKMEGSKPEFRGSVILSGHTKYVSCLEILPTGELASGSHDNTIKIWNITTGACVKTLKGHKNESAMAMGIKCIKLLPTGELASSSLDNTIKIWNIKKGSCIATFSETSTLCFELFAGQLISGTYSRSIKLWDIKTGRSEARYLHGMEDIPYCLKYLPTGELAIGCLSSKIIILDFKATNIRSILLGHSRRITSLVLLLTGELVSSSDDTQIRIWDIQAATCQKTRA